MACTEATPDTEMLAVVDGVTITKAQLVSRLELTPMLKSNPKTDLVDEALNIIIDEIIVSRWAKANKWDRDIDYKKRISFTRKQALIRELFYIEIRDQSTPTKIEINDAVQKSLTQLTIGILLTQDEGISNEWMKLISAEKTYEEIEAYSDSNLEVQDSVLSFHWGDNRVPKKIQKIAYETKIGGISNVFTVPLGYGILSVINRTTNVFIDPHSQRPNRQEISKIIQARKEDMMAGMYTEHLLKSIKVEQIARGFREVSGYLSKAADLNGGNGAAEINVKDIEMKPEDQYDLSIIIIKSPDLEWDGNYVLSLLKQYNYSVASGGIESISKSLSVFLKGAVRDHYLEERAEQLGMASNVRVKEDIDLWSRYYLYLEGIKQMISDDKTIDYKLTIRKEINKMRSKANIVINQELVKTVQITEIPMLVMWKSDISKNLAVPPLVGF